jgi:hypothetical protein
MLGGSGNIKKNTKLKPMDIPLDYEIGLDITPNNKIEKKWANIVHFTATGKDCSATAVASRVCGSGRALASFWWWTDTPRMATATRESGNATTSC